jgi:putative nucleotidyltransferase with HDIG domain
MARSILFVDDEPSIRGIYEMLPPFLGADYSVRTAPSGDEALGLMGDSRYDVIVSDLTMPRMTGIELLTQVTRRFPGTARIVVSGFADEITSAKCLMVGHRYFTKPFNPTALSEVIVSLCNARTFAANDRVRDYVGKIDAIPTLSRTYLELTKALRSNTLPLREISSIIEQDLALTAKVLQTVNSVRFSPARNIRTVFDAVQIIGFEVVRALVLSIQVFEFCQSTAKTDLFKSVWDHSLRTAVRARRIAEMQSLSDEFCDETFLLGLLHDIGKVVLAASCPDQYHSLWGRYGGNSESLIEAETREFGANHAHVGAYLLRLWGLPEPVASAVEVHHSLDAVEISDFCPLLALHVTQELAPNRAGANLNTSVLQKLGLEDQIPAWRSVVEQNGSPRTV